MGDKSPKDIKHRSKDKKEQYGKSKKKQPVLDMAQAYGFSKTGGK